MVFYPNFPEEEIDQMLFQYSGVSELINHFDIFNDITIIDEQKFSDDLFWVHFQNEYIDYFLILDFEKHLIRIIYFSCKLNDDKIFLKLLCGIINNAGRKFEQLSTVAMDRLTTLCAISGFNPDDASLAELLVVCQELNYDFTSIDDLFTNGVHLLKNKRIKWNANFALFKHSNNIRLLKLKLFNLRLSHWLHQ